MEVATWDGPTIHRTSTRLGLRSEASGRFEKGLAPEQALDAPGGRGEADGRAVRRDGASRARSTSAAGGRAAARHPPARARASRRCSARRSPRERQRAILNALGFDTDAARRRPRRDRALLAAQRRHPRGRPDRGGRAARRRRQAAGDAAAAARGRRRPAHPRPARAPRGRGRARRLRPARDRRLELHRAGGARPPAPAGRPPDARRRRAREPDERGAVDHAPDDPRLAARRAPLTTSPATSATWRCSSPARRVPQRGGRRTAPAEPASADEHSRARAAPG